MSGIVKEALGLLGKALNLDSWSNALTGFGTSRDKTQYGQFEANFRLQDQELTDLYNHDDISRKVVGLVPEEAFREGFSLSTNDPRAAEAVLKRAEILDLENAFLEAWRWGRLYGGAVIYVGADDGQAADTPLRPALVRSVDFLDVFDRRRVWPWRYYGNPKHPKFGKPEVYALQSLTGGIAYVHDSRLVVFRGAHTDDYTRRTLNYWDFSVLQNCHEAIEHFNEIFRASRIMMTDASQGVFKMKGLIGMIAGGQRQLLETRAQMLDMGRSVARSIMLDAGSAGEEGESFTKIATQFAGVGDQLSQAAKRLAAATGIPVIILMGETPSGLNASGDANVRLWYDGIRSQQRKIVIPRMTSVYTLIGNALGFKGETYPITAKSLWQETPAEEAARRLVVAQTDVAYAGIEVLTPEEIAANRFRKDGWNAETKIDLTSRLGSFPEPEDPALPALPAKPPAPALPPGKP